MIVTSGRVVYERAERDGLVEALSTFGARFVTDTCWCMLGEPVVSPTARNIMTNSAKYAHYAPGLVGRGGGVHLGGLSACIDAACTGSAPTGAPAWLRGDRSRSEPVDH